jgi:hypothetical protein
MVDVVVVVMVLLVVVNVEVLLLKRPVSLSLSLSPSFLSYFTKKNKLERFGRKGRLQHCSSFFFAK